MKALIRRQLHNIYIYILIDLGCPPEFCFATDSVDVSTVSTCPHHGSTFPGRQISPSVTTSNHPLSVAYDRASSTVTSLR
jgi:hypothetical protein